MWSDQELKRMLSDAYHDAGTEVAPSAGLATAVRRRHAVSARRRAMAGVAVPVAAAAAVGVTVASVQSPSGPGRPPAAGSTSDATTPAAQPGTYRLAGYSFTLPDEFAARQGACTLRLPDGDTREGTPGARSSCADAWVAEQPPSWVPRKLAPKPGAITIDEDGSVFTSVLPVPADRGSGFVVIAIDRPSGGPVDIRKMIDKALDE